MLKSFHNLNGFNSLPNSSLWFHYTEFRKKIVLKCTFTNYLHDFVSFILKLRLPHWFRIFVSECSTTLMEIITGTRDEDSEVCILSLLDCATTNSSEHSLHQICSWYCHFLDKIFLIRNFSVIWFKYITIKLRLQFLKAKLTKT